MSANTASAAQVQFDSPYAFGEAISPDNDADLPNPTRAIWIGGTGAVKADLVGGSTVTLAAVPVGLLPIRAKRVYADGTAATNMVALW